MRTVTEAINIYKFNELSEEIQQKVIEKNRYFNTEDIDWYDGITDTWAEKLSEFGFEDVSIYFTGFCSQGDGACFDANSFSIESYSIV